MTYEEFMAVITSKSPSPNDYQRAVLYAESSSIETLWAALITVGGYLLFIKVINKVLQGKVVQANLDTAMNNIAHKLKSSKPGK